MASCPILIVTLAVGVLLISCVGGCREPSPTGGEAATMPATTQAAPQAEVRTALLPQHAVGFDHPDGPYTLELFRSDFRSERGPGPDRGFGRIKDGALQVVFNPGKKVSETGYSAHIGVPPRDAYEVSFRLRFPRDFEAGLHGKQIGLSGGKGYDGGRGKPARENGYGWSIRLQFDSKPDVVTNTLYVYHSNMTGDYGGPMGARPFPMQRDRWYQIRLVVRMNSSPQSSDGSIGVWCDGEQKIDVRGVQFVRKAEGLQIDRVRLEVFPGGGGAFPSAETYIEFDDFRWSDSPQP